MKSAIVGSTAIYRGQAVTIIRRSRYLRSCVVVKRESDNRLFTVQVNQLTKPIEEKA